MDDNDENEETISILKPNEDSEEDFDTIRPEAEDIFLPRDTLNTHKNTDFFCKQLEGNDSCKTNFSSFVRFDAPTFLCHHLPTPPTPPAVGKDDDRSKLRENLLIKSGHSILPGNQKETILIATDHKFALNVFELIKLPRYKVFLHEFLVLHPMR